MRESKWHDGPARCGGLTPEDKFLRTSWAHTLASRRAAGLLILLRQCTFHGCALRSPAGPPRHLAGRWSDIRLGHARTRHDLVTVALVLFVRGRHFQISQAVGDMSPAHRILACPRDWWLQETSTLILRQTLRALRHAGDLNKTD